ncbi:MAG: hypothetical protein KGS61_12355 [Verrucomicrobia bacterium]|nr:hypothetical protein [Verrucomicrobiota bacterium]
MLQREWEIVATAANGAREFDPFIGREFAPNPALDAEQSAALHRLVRSRDFISLFRGGAGTGKTVDYVLFSDSAVKVATNDQQWYVTISRGRKGIRIYTPDKDQLRENVIRSGQRRLALEITGPPRSIRVRRIGRRVVLTQWYERFGRQPAEWMIAARRARRFNRNRQLKHVHQIKHRATRMLVG